MNGFCPCRTTTHRQYTAHIIRSDTVELIPTLGALPPRGGPVQDPVLTSGAQ